MTASPRPTLYVPLPNSWLQVSELEPLLQQHALEAVLRRGARVVLQFPAECRIPAGLGICLLSFLNQIAALEPGEVCLEFAAGSELFGYLDRSGFLRLLSSAVVTHPQRPKISGAEVHRGKAKTLLEIAPLHSRMSIEESQSVHQQLTAKLEELAPSTRGASQLLGHVRTALAELIQNVPNHSQTQAPGYAVLQAYTKGRNPRVEIGVSDSGVGIPASLRGALGSRLSQRSDSDLIVEVFRSGLSSMGPGRGRGCGLPKCAQLAARYGSSVSVRTPSAFIRLKPLPDQSPRLEAEVWDDVASIRGTHIWFDFPLSGYGSRRD